MKMRIFVSRDAGAVAALKRGKSLLPAGVQRVDGAFSRGDAIAVRGPDGAEVARGLSAYDAEDAAKIAGRSWWTGRRYRLTCFSAARGCICAAGLAMGEAAEGIPAALVRGLTWDAPDNDATALVRPVAMDLFR